MAQRGELILADPIGVRHDPCWKLPQQGVRPSMLRGLLGRSLVFWFLAGRDARRPRRLLCTGQESRDGPVVFCFAGTLNQLASLRTTISALESQDGIATRVVISPDIEETAAIAAEVVAVENPIQCYLVVGWLFITRFKSLYRRLSQIAPELAALRFNAFLDVYRWLPLWWFILSKRSYAFVLLSNDHNVSNCCLSAMAAVLNIPTAYLQHASVTKAFPPLRFDYAFLDGQVALDHYINSEVDAGDKFNFRPPSVIILSGQKKAIHPQIAAASLGLAVNRLDDMEYAIGLAYDLSRRGIPLIVRWHPYQGRVDVARIKSGLPKTVLLSDPNSQSVSAFLARTRMLLAGGSSIHLEAALSGIHSVYHDLTGSGNLRDVYGYVAEGISTLCQDIDQICDEWDQAPRPPDLGRQSSLKRFSDTIGTSWEGHEGTLVSACLSAILRDRPLTEILRQGSQQGLTVLRPHLM